MTKVSELTAIKDSLGRINKELDKIEKIAPSGDVVKNFREDKTGRRHTDRIIKIIDKELIGEV